MTQQTFLSAHAVPPREVVLHRIWRVEADSGYDVYHKPGNDGGWRVIRTLEGEGTLCQEDGTRVPLHAGDVACVESRRIERYFCSGDGWKFWWFECGIKGEPLRTLSRSVPLRREEAAVREDIWRNLRHTRPEGGRLATAAFAYLLHLWQTVQSDEHDPEDRISELVAEIPLRCGETWTVREMAKHAGMSERSFRDHFQRITGQSPAAYRNDIRLRIAAEQLVRSRRQVQEIASDLGFSSPFHFSKAFRTRFGVSPRVYRLRNTRTPGPPRDD